jgi:hypothetical protein
MKAYIAAASVAFAAAAEAGSISFTNTQVDLNGTGFGNVLNVLSLANRTSEFGSVLWDGGADVLTDDAANTSQTHTSAVLQSKGIGGVKMALYFNGNEPGNAPGVTLGDFTLRFQKADGQKLFDVIYDAPSGGLAISDFGGTGQSGWLFEVSLTSGEASQFYGDAANRIGMLIDANNAITGTAGGAENFFLGKLDSPPGPGGGSPTPEPSGLAVWALGALAVGIVKKVRRV